MLLLTLKRKDFVNFFSTATVNIVWIRSRNRNTSKIGTGTAINHYSFPTQLKTESRATVVAIRVVCLVGNPLDDIEGEGADLLDGVDGDLVLEAALPPLLYQVVVHLA